MSIWPTGEGPRYQKSQRAADKAEREAAKRIETAEKRARQAETDSSHRIDEIRDQFVRTREAELAREEQTVQAEHDKSYENLRTLQHQQQVDLSKTRRQGEEDLQQLQNYYRDTVYKTDRDGDKALNDHKAVIARKLEFENRSAEDLMAAARDSHQKQMSSAVASHDARIAQLTSAEREEYDRLHENTEIAREAARQKFQNQYQSTIQTQQETLDRLNSRASQKIRDIREDTAQKLDAYSDRQDDPFYKLVNLDADVRETPDAFILTARVPEHEQRNITVSVRGGRQLVVSGFRRNEEKLEPEPGHTQSTSSYQSFSESFPLSWPVNGRGLSREFDGDELIVTLPKQPTYAAPAPFKAKAERFRAERPHFPPDLPGVHDPEAKPTDPKSRGIDRGEPGSGTLS
jgi:HSP20 family molecular chaperone IbpA